MYDVGIRPSYDRSVSSIFVQSSGVGSAEQGPAVGAEGVTRARVISVQFSRRREVVHGGAASVLVDVGQDHRCARLGEGTRRGEPRAAAASP